jgi:hypothetical protein
MNEVVIQGLMQTYGINRYQATTIFNDGRKSVDYFMAACEPWLRRKIMKEHKRKLMKEHTCAIHKSG